MSKAPHPNTIDRHLPKMRCDDNCGECCSVVACSKPEYDRVIEYARANGIEPLKQGVSCPWYQGGQCAVHPARPAVCRLYGHTESMECPRGYNVNIPLTVERRIFRPFIPSRTDEFHFLHEAVMSVQDVFAMISEAT